MGAGAHGGFGTAHDGPPLALVCTNGTPRPLLRRPRPPARRRTGRRRRPDVWETTHLGGHRFAPTMLVLPHGYAYGRLDAGRAKDVLEAARRGRVVLRRLPRPLHVGPPGQAAELAVRALTGEDLAGALTVERTPPDPGAPTAR